MYEDFFLRPSDPMQKRYEALRASFVHGLSTSEVARRFGYSIHTVHALLSSLTKRPHTTAPFYPHVERSHDRAEETKLLHRGD
jgi:transposase